MKRICLLVLVFICALTANAQFFSGELTYKKRIIAKTPKFNLDSAAAADLGPEMTYLITRGFYKSSYFKDGKEAYSYTYHDESKRMYDERAEKDYITYRDSRKGNTSVIRTRIYKDSTREVAGHVCFMTEGIYEKYIQKTYYATDLSIDPESYKGHEVGDWYNRIKQVKGALSLMSISEYTNHIEILEVVEITPRTLKPKDFEIPGNKIVVASYSALDKRVEMETTSLASQACIRKKIGEAPSTNEKVVCYVSFIVSDKGKISNIEPYEKDDAGYYKIAIDIVSSCGLEFKPGEIMGKPVSSLIYFPVSFGGR
jgi:hypothetical protein